MMQEVPKADVVIVNPTHFAVALRYDEKRMRAPLVVAKGADLVAARIREIATEHSVPIFEAPPLARALFQAVSRSAARSRRRCTSPSRRFSPTSISSGPRGPRERGRRSRPRSTPASTPPGIDP